MDELLTKNLDDTSLTGAWHGTYLCFSCTIQACAACYWPDIEHRSLSLSLHLILLTAWVLCVVRMPLFTACTSACTSAWVYFSVYTTEMFDEKA